MGLTLYLFVCNAFEAMADVAQLVEPRFVVPVVVSSSLIVRPNKKDISSEMSFLYYGDSLFKQWALKSRVVGNCRLYIRLDGRTDVF